MNFLNDNFDKGYEWAELYIHNLIFNKRLPETKILIQQSIKSLHKLDDGPYSRGMLTAYHQFLNRHMKTATCLDVPIR